MARQFPRAPDHLSEPAAAWWVRIVKGWDLDDAALLILQTSLEAFDRMVEAQQVIQESGLLVDGKVSPAARVERDSRAALLAGIKQLHLDLEPVGPVGRPPGGGR